MRGEVEDRQLREALASRLPVRRVRPLTFGASILHTHLFCVSHPARPFLAPVFKVQALPITAPSGYITAVAWTSSLL